MAKGSLFGRLMNSGNNTTNDYEEEDDRVFSDQGELLVEEVDIEEDEQDTDPSVSEEVAPAGSFSPSQSGGSWMSDYDGQLNIDMYQTKDNVIIKSTLAGVKSEDLDITVANDVVTVRGTRHREEDVPQADIFYSECYWGSFSRSVIVPVDIDSEHIEADLKDGILTIVIPKAAKAKTRKVKVRSV